MVPPTLMAAETPDLTGIGPVPGDPDRPMTAGPAIAAGALPPGATAASPGPSGSAEGADALQRSPFADAATTMATLKSMPLLNQAPPTRAQHDLWTAVLVPAAGHHVEAATALAVTTPVRTDAQLAAVITHIALTLALADLPQDERRALRSLAAGVYEQLEAAMPNILLAGLPPRDLLGGLPLQFWAPGLEVRLTALVLALVVVAVAIWAGLR